MPSGRQISGFAHHAVRTPDDQVHSPGTDDAPAAGTGVLLDRLRGRDGLNRPLATVAGLRALPSREETIEGLV